MGDANNSTGNGDDGYRPKTLSIFIFIPILAVMGCVLFCCCRCFYRKAKECYDGELTCGDICSSVVSCFSGCCKELCEIITRSHEDRGFTSTNIPLTVTYKQAYKFGEGGGSDQTYEMYRPHIGDVDTTAARFNSQHAEGYHP